MGLTPGTGAPPLIAVMDVPCVPAHIRREPFSSPCFSLYDTGLRPPTPSVSDLLTTRSGRQLTVTVVAKVHTKWGDSVAIVGSTTALGSWDPQRGLRMTTDPSTYPQWRTELALPAGASFEFKLVILHRKQSEGTSGEVEWEPLELNRRFDPCHRQPANVLVTAEWGHPLVGSPSAPGGASETHRRASEGISGSGANGSVGSGRPSAAEILQRRLHGCGPVVPPSPLPPPVAMPMGMAAQMPAAPAGGLLAHATPPTPSLPPFSSAAAATAPPWVLPPVARPAPVSLKGLPPPMALASPLAARRFLGTGLTPSTELTTSLAAHDTYLTPHGMIPHGLNPHGLPPILSLDQSWPPSIANSLCASIDASPCRGQMSQCAPRRALSNAAPGKTDTLGTELDTLGTELDTLDTSLMFGAPLVMFGTPLVVFGTDLVTLDTEQVLLLQLSRLLPPRLEATVAAAV